jgi:RimJ/RimL family protein N-acetyltransferase
MAIPTIETDRLILRAPAATDFPVYRAFFADAEASSYYGGPLAEDRAAMAAGRSSARPTGR